MMRTMTMTILSNHSGSELFGHFGHFGHGRVYVKQNTGLWTALDFGLYAIDTLCLTVLLIMWKK